LAAYTRISFSQLVQRMTERLGDNSVFWTEPEKRYAINEAIRVWAVMTGQWSKRFSIPTQAGQRFYPVPKQLVSLQRMRYDNTPMYQASMAELDYGYSNWQSSANGTPSVWTPIGFDLFAINPPAAAGHTLWLEGIALAPFLIGNDDINIGDEEVNRILDYAHSYGAFKEGGQEFDETQPLMENFASACVERNQRLLATGIFKKYLGLWKDEGERPPRSPEQSVGARGN
jgi:hypothetical protein